MMRKSYLGQQFGRYRLVGFLGEGGSAQVYLGEHSYLNTRAAVKVLDAQLTEQEIEHFRNEAGLIASLKHPHIVRVFDFGVENSIPYLIMQYAPNGSLRDRHPKGQMLSPETVVQYINQVASALQFAHEQKVIHRDVKPENMLIDARGDILLSDFGFAVLSQSSHHLALQEVVGTISYMAPEQWHGKPCMASDQYALAIVAYEWLCGDSPFHGSVAEIASQHIVKLPPSLHKKVPTVTPQVERVLFKALEKDPHQRFERVQVFAEALDLAVSTRKSLPPALFTRRAMLLGIGGLALAGIGVSGTLLLYLQKSRASAHSSLSPRNPATTPSLPASLTPTAFPGETVYIYHGHSGPVTTVSWSPKGKSVASIGLDGSVQVWEGLTGKVIAKRSGSAHDPLFVWSPDGTRIALINQTGFVQIWNTTSRNNLSTYNPYTAPTSLAWSSDGNYLAAAGDSNYNESAYAQVWKISSGQTVFFPQTNFAWCVAWAPDKSILALGHDSSPYIELWDIINAKRLTTYSGEGAVRFIAWSPDGKRLASANTDGAMQIWNATTGQLITTQQRDNTTLYGNSDIAWSPDGARIAAVNNSYDIEIHSAVTGKVLFVYTGHVMNVNTVSWSPDGLYIASGDDNSEVHIWQAT